MDSRIELVKGDITKIKSDAIVNAANRTLMGGGGVDGAIHLAAGPELLEECKKIGECPTGEVRVTGAYKLPATWVFHAVGPRWKGGADGEDELLRACYRNSLLMAEKCFVRTISFPCISTGIYGFPADRACRIALKEIDRFLKASKTIAKVIIVCFEDTSFNIYKEELEAA